MQYARIANGAVAEIGTFQNAPVFHASMLWVQIDGQPNAAQVAVGWTWDPNARVFAAPVLTLAQAQAAQLAALGGVYAGLLGAGYTWNGKLFQIDQGTSQPRITSMGSLAAASLVAGSAVVWPANFVWIAADNSQVPMTAVQMLAFAQAVALHVAALVMQNAAIRASITAAPDLATLNGININAGWPANAGGAAGA